MIVDCAPLIVVPGLLVLLQSTPALAQIEPVDPGLVSMAVEVPASRNLSTSADPGRPVSTWRSFAELAELQLRFPITNESTTALWVNRGALRNAIQFRVDAEAAVPVSTRWLDEMLVHEETLPVLVPPDELVLLEPQQIVVWTVAIRRVDGQSFGSGAYRVTMDSRNARNAVRDVRGQAWSGRGLDDGPFPLVVRIELPTTPAEWGLRYILEAHEKASRNEFTSALNAYTRATEVNPADFAGMLGMAEMYRRLNRYGEAIALYEKVFDASKRADPFMSVLLALTYVGAGNEEKAANTLRSGGIQEEEISVRIRGFRARIASERSQPER